ncbi:MAG: ABC transporter permease [Lachnospiraceae bacterium]|nr:ABC transporter permease [Lachnospiraceae bacterium]
MKKYWSFFRLRFVMGLQYRTAAAAGMVTQFVWGFMECFAFQAFYETNPAAFPMEFSAMVAYIWLQQAFLAMFMAWMMENDIFEMIVSGNIAYELCRPVSIYQMWFARTIATRVSRALLRCIPILAVAFLLPKPYGMTLPADLGTFLAFAGTMVLGLLVAAASCLLVYVLAFFTISGQGLRIFMVSLVEFLSGAIIPLPFLPQPFRTVAQCLPFASMQNVPLRIYGGDLAGRDMGYAVLLQVFWLVFLVLLGKGLCRRAERRIVVQGG